MLKTSIDKFAQSLQNYPNWMCW